MTKSNTIDDHKSKKVKLTKPNTLQDAPPPETPPVIYHCSVESCPHKGIKFTQKSVWYRHMTETHAPWPDGRFYCPFKDCKCHKSGFRYRVHYKQHMEWHVFHKDMLAKTIDDDPEEVAKASQESELLVAAGSGEVPPRTRFADSEALAQDVPCDSTEGDDLWDDVAQAVGIDWSRIRP